jgi:thiol:disulfide interchange protein DsbD
MPSWAATAKVDIVYSQDRYPAGGLYPILFNIRISSGLYIHGTKESGSGLIPTVLSFPEHAEIRLENVQFPTPAKKRFDHAEEPVEIFSGEILVRATLVVNEKAPTGKQVINGQLSYQACSSRSCLPPENVPVLLVLSVAPQGAQANLLNQKRFESEDRDSSVHLSLPGLTSEAGFWLTLFVIFMWGLGLNLTPCIYPLIPITVSYFGGMSKEIRGRTIVHGLLYVSGIAFTNSFFGLTASLTGSMIGRILQEPIVLFLVAGIFVFLALSFFGLWEFQIPSSMTRLVSKNFGGYSGTFFMGLTLGTVAAPCLGPFILALLIFVAQKGDPLMGFVYFFVLSIGMGLPLAVLAIFSGALKKLPLSGNWMIWIRKAFGWILVGMAGYMLLPLIPGPLGKSILVSAILAAAGLHLGWLDRSRGTLLFFPYFKKGLGVILVCAAATFFFSSSKNGEGVKWIPYDKSVLIEAAKENRPVILDFYADWCLPCRTMENKVFRGPEVVKLSQDFVTMRVDLTKRHPHQEELQERYQIRGVPTIIFINKRGIVERELRVESFVNRDEFLKRMKRLKEK